MNHVDSGLGSGDPFVPLPSADDEIWRVYQREIDGKPFVASINEGLCDAAFQSGRDMCLEISLTASETKANGLPTSDAYSAFQRLNDDIQAAMAKATGANSAYAARLTGDGMQTLFLYLPSPVVVVPEVVSIAKRHGIACECTLTHDPDWQIWIEKAWPTSDEQRWCLDGEVIDNSVRHGDRVEVPRPIEHCLYFSDESAIATFADWATAQGFEVSSVSEDESGKWCVLVVKIAPLEIGAVFAQTSALTAAAAEHGGEYDGWGTVIVK